MSHDQVQNTFLRTLVLLNKVKLSTTCSLDHLGVTFWVPILHFAKILIVVDEVNAVEVLLAKVCPSFFIFQLFDGQHGNRIVANLHLGL